MRIEEYNIYANQSSRSILMAYLDARKQQDENFSVRKWANLMGMNSHSLLALQLQGKRKIKAQHVDRLASTMGLTENELRFFKGVTIVEKSTSDEERNYNLTNLLQNIPNNHLKTRKYNEFILLADWLNMAILALSELDHVVLTEEYILEKLGHKASKAEIVNALELLVNEDLLKRNDGQFEVTYQSICTNNDYADLGIKEYHKKACELAKDSVDQIDLDHREFQSFCMGIPDEKIPLAKDMIRKFRDDLYCRWQR